MNESDLLDVLNERLDGNWQSLERLHGGFINLVWRAHGGKQRAVVKHAPPFVASLPQVPLSPTRLRFEALCLNHFGGRAGPVSPPRLLGYFKDLGLLIMEDCGEAPSLDQALRRRQVDGTALGKWIRRLHDFTGEKEEFETLLRNQDVQEARFESQYRQVGVWLNKTQSSDAAKLGGIAEQLGNRLMRSGRCVIMGDLWPRSILIGTEKTWLIDWEFAHYGSPIQDIGHLAAHCWMQAHTTEDLVVQERWLRFWFGFQRAYGTLSAADRRDAAVHIGAEILTRAVGAFREGYVYADDEIRSSRIAEATTVARRCLSEWSLDDFASGGAPWAYLRKQ